MVVNLIGDRDLSMGESLENFLVGFGHFGFDVVKEQRESFATELIDLLQFPFKGCDFFWGAVGHVEAGRQSVIENDVVLFGRRNETGQVVSLFDGVQFTPVCTMFVVVFGCVNVRVHAPTFQFAEKIFSLFGGPGATVESFDNATNEFWIVVVIL